MNLRLFLLSNRSLIYGYRMTARDGVENEVLGFGLSFCSTQPPALCLRSHIAGTDKGISKFDLS